MGLAPARRDELVAEVREHIERGAATERAAGAARRATSCEAGVRNVLDRLGPPEEIARAAVDDEPAAALPQGALGANPAGRQPARRLDRPAADVRRFPHRHRLGGGSRAALDVATMACARQVARDVGLAVRLRRGGPCRRDRWLVRGVDDLCTSSSAVRAGAAAHQTCTTSGFSLPGWLGVVVLVVLLVAPILVAVRLLRTRAHRRLLTTFDRRASRQQACTPVDATPSLPNVVNWRRGRRLPWGCDAARGRVRPGHDPHRHQTGHRRGLGRAGGRDRRR